jgi:hypothetical protein
MLAAAAALSPPRVQGLEKIKSSKKELNFDFKNNNENVRRSA